MGISPKFSDGHKLYCTFYDFSKSDRGIKCTREACWWKYMEGLNSIWGSETTVTRCGKHRPIGVNWLQL